MGLRGRRKARADRLLAAITLTFGYCLIDGTTGKILEANERVHQMLGWEQGTLPGEPLDAVMPERSRATHKIDRARYMEHPSVRPMGPEREVWMQRRDGSEVRVWIGLSPLDDTVAAAIMPIHEEIPALDVGHG